MILSAESVLGFRNNCNVLKYRITIKVLDQKSISLTIAVIVK